MDLNLEENKKKISAALQQLKIRLAQEEKKVQEAEIKKKEMEEKCYNLSQQKLQIDQKLAKVELALKRKGEEVLEKEEKVNELQIKLDTLLNIQSSKKGIFSFGNDENKQLKKELLYLQSEYEIKESELQRLHELHFEKKKHYKRHKEELKQLIQDLENKIQQQVQLIEQEQKQKQDLEVIILNQKQTIVERDQQLRECKIRLNELDDEIRLQKDQIQLQQQQYNEIQNTLIHKKDELKRNYQETDSMKMTLQQIKETLFNTIPLLEAENSTSQAVQCLKQFADKIFGVDKQREVKGNIIYILVNQIKLEQELQKELLTSKDSYQVFQKAKEKILKMGKTLESLEKKNKQLSDRIYLLENKRAQGKGDLLSDKISVI